jgi:hypothetical protein
MSNALHGIAAIWQIARYPEQVYRCRYIAVQIAHATVYCCVSKMRWPTDGVSTLAQPQLITKNPDAEMLPCSYYPDLPYCKQNC